MEDSIPNNTDDDVGLMGVNDTVLAEKKRTLQNLLNERLRIGKTHRDLTQSILSLYRLVENVSHSASNLYHNR